MMNITISFQSMSRLLFFSSVYVTLHVSPSSLVYKYSIYICPNTHTYTHRSWRAPNIKGGEITISIPKPRAQVFQEWILSFAGADKRSVLFRRIRGGGMWQHDIQVLSGGTYQTRLITGTPGEVGSKRMVFGVFTGEETIDNVKKDQYVESTFITSTNCCRQICSDDTGPHMWTCKVMFEDDNNVSGVVSTKFTIKLRQKPMGCITCGNSGNIPCIFLFPPICIQVSLAICCAMTCCSQEKAWSRSRRTIQRRANDIKHGLLKGFTSPNEAHRFMTQLYFGGASVLMDAQGPQYQMQRMFQGGFGNIQTQRPMQISQMGGTIPVATATAVPIHAVTVTTVVPVQTTTPVSVTTTELVGTAPSDPNA